jgi:N-formylglutamate amidohydrolase
VREPFCTITKGEIPIIATAIHSGHFVRPEVADQLKISEIDRLREEDPYTSGWTEISESRIICNKSRFEVDLNRTRDKAVYISPEDAWGLDVWETEPSISLINDSLAYYDKFYQEVKQLILDIKNQYGYFVALDLHSYNYLRNGPKNPPANPSLNPDINIGTDSIINVRWKPLIKRFIAELRNASYLNHQLDIRENIKFKGGNFPRWINTTFADSGCAIAVEVKKIFMNEWTGVLYKKRYNAIKKVLASTIPGMVEGLQIIKEQ